MRLAITLRQRALAAAGMGDGSGIAVRDAQIDGASARRPVGENLLGGRISTPAATATGGRSVRAFVHGSPGKRAFMAAAIGPDFGGP